LNKFNFVLDVLEEKNNDLYKHSERVAMLCYEFGRVLEIENKNIEILYKAAFLHEIGKCDFPEVMTIEGKEIKLNDVYPLFSKAVVYSLGDKYISDILAQQLEKVDGTGHPCGIKEDVHLFATIIRICDMYDNYRSSGESHNTAIANIRKEGDFPKKLITSFIKTLLDNEDLELWG
jgi:HD-GYP domain-containing protein (c-di-GMP phosphodiesterase class II)